MSCRKHNEVFYGLFGRVFRCGTYFTAKALSIHPADIEIEMNKKGKKYSSYIDRSKSTMTDNLRSTVIYIMYKISKSKMKPHYRYNWKTKKAERVN